MADCDKNDTLAPIFEEVRALVEQMRSKGYRFQGKGPAARMLSELMDEMVGALLLPEGIDAEIEWGGALIGIAAIAVMAMDDTLGAVNAGRLFKLTVCLEAAKKAGKVGDLDSPCGQG